MAVWSHLSCMLTDPGAVPMCSKVNDGPEVNDDLATFANRLDSPMERVPHHSEFIGHLRAPDHQSNSPTVVEMPRIPHVSERPIGFRPTYEDAMRAGPTLKDESGGQFMIRSATGGYQEVSQQDNTHPEMKSNISQSCQLTDHCSTTNVPTSYLYNNSPSKGLSHRDCSEWLSYRAAERFEIFLNIAPQVLLL